jgi:hypothetical protein
MENIVPGGTLIVIADAIAPATSLSSKQLIKINLSPTHTKTTY